MKRVRRWVSQIGRPRWLVIETRAMQLPRWIVKVIDPATVYMQDSSASPQGPMFRGGAVFGPEVPDGARQATLEELDDMRARASAGPRRETPHDYLTGPEVTTAAQQLMDRGRTTFRSGERGLSADIVPFWHGDSVLHISAHAPNRGFSSSSRIPRNLIDQHLPMLVSYLADALHSLGQPPAH